MKKLAALCAVLVLCLVSLAAWAEDEDNLYTFAGFRAGISYTKAKTWASSRFPTQVVQESTDAEGGKYQKIAFTEPQYLRGYLLSLNLSVKDDLIVVCAVSVAEQRFETVPDLAAYLQKTYAWTREMLSGPHATATFFMSRPAVMPMRDYHMPTTADGEIDFDMMAQLCQQNMGIGMRISWKNVLFGVDVAHTYEDAHEVYRVNAGFDVGDRVRTESQVHPFESFSSYNPFE